MTATEMTIADLEAEGPPAELLGEILDGPPPEIVYAGFAGTLDHQQFSVTLSGTFLGEAWCAANSEVVRREQEAAYEGELTKVAEAFLAEGAGQEATRLAAEYRRVRQQADEARAEAAGARESYTTHVRTGASKQADASRQAAEKADEKARRADELAKDLHSVAVIALDDARKELLTRLKQKSNAITDDAFHERERLVVVLLEQIAEPLRHIAIADGLSRRDLPAASIGFDPDLRFSRYEIVAGLQPINAPTTTKGTP